MQECAQAEGQEKSQLEIRMKEVEKRLAEYPRRLERLNKSGEEKLSRTDKDSPFFPQALKVVPRHTSSGKKTFNNTRNKSNYDVADLVSEQDLLEITKLATELQGQVIRWLQESYPELLTRANRPWQRMQVLVPYR
jgi:hypothetical protein